jgi:hypothetical protein
MTHRFEVAPGIEVTYLGPPLNAGPLPALFYFALSGEDSLGLDPFNQPAIYLASLPMRIFSMTLPGHEDKLPPTNALNVWASEIILGNNVISTFIEKIKWAVDTLLSRQVLMEDRLAIAGLSRGAFIAVHAAAAIPQFQWILGFAPLTKLESIKEFRALASHPIVASLSLEHLTLKLMNRSTRFYIGNLDTRVGTGHCFDFIENLAKTADENKIRCPQVELMITPSIGRDGHGTSKGIFHAGAQWVAESLRAIDVL